MGAQALTAAREKNTVGEFITLADGLTRYQLSGNPQHPLVVLVHGLTGPLESWDKNTPALLDAGFRVLRYDLYGRGLSDRLKGKQYNLQTCVDQLDDLLTQLDLPQPDLLQPIHLVGWSMGAVIASAFAVRYQDRVHKLALVAPAGMPSKLPLAARAGRWPIIADGLVHLIGKRTLCNGDGFFRPQDAKEYVSVIAPQMDLPGFNAATVAYLRYFPLDNATAVYTDLVATVMPKLGVWGEVDQVISLECQTALQTLVPSLQAHTIAESGHALHYEKPTEFNALLLQFLST